VKGHGKVTGGTLLIIVTFAKKIRNTRELKNSGPVFKVCSPKITTNRKCINLMIRFRIAKLNLIR